MVPCKMLHLIIVITDSLTCILSISTVTCSARGISCIDIGNRAARVLPSLRLVVIPLLLPSSLLVRGFASEREV